MTDASVREHFLGRNVLEKRSGFQPEPELAPYQPLPSSAGNANTPFPILIKRTHPRAQIPTKKFPGDAGLDLYTVEADTIEPGQFLDVHTGVYVALPEGVWGMIVGRSSTIRQHGMRVETGIIDNDYRGELFFGIWNQTPDKLWIQPGMRLAQLILMPLVVSWFEEVNQLPPSARGENGFGSTGR